MPTASEIVMALISAGGFIAIVAIGGLAWVIFQKKVKLGRGLQVGAGIVMAIVAGIGLNIAGIFGMIGFAPAAITPTNQIMMPSESSPQSLVESVQQPSSAGGTCTFVQNTNALQTAIYNKENSSNLGYLAGSIAAESDGKTLDTGTTTGGSTLSYLQLDVTPCKTGMIYVLGTNGVGVASAKKTFSSYESESQYVIDSAASDVISILAYDRQGNKKSSGNVSCLTGDSTGASCYAVSGASTTDGAAYYSNTSLTTGGSIQGQIGLDVNGTTSVYGTYEATDGVMFSFDSVDASKFSVNAFTLSQIDNIGLQQVTCPASIVANRNAEKCWSSRTLKDTDGEVLLNYQLKADVGDPSVTGDSPVLCVDDKQFFRGADGNIKYDFFNSAGTNQGAAGVCLTFVME